MRLNDYRGNFCQNHYSDVPPHQHGTMTMFNIKYVGGLNIYKNVYFNLSEIISQKFQNASVFYEKKIVTWFV